MFVHVHVARIKISIEFCSPFNFSVSNNNYSDVLQQPFCLKEGLFLYQSHNPNILRDLILLFQ